MSRDPDARRTGGDPGGRDVLVTGIGLVTPLGTDADATWAAAVAGETGAGPLTRFDPDGLRLRSRITCEIAAEFTDHDRIDARNTGRYGRLAVAAATEALDDAGLDLDGDGWDADRTGVAIGTGIGGSPEYEEGVADVRSSGRPSPRFVVRFLPNLAAGQVSIAVDARGPNRAPATACAAGAQAIADAVDDVRLGRADAMLAGGTESAFTPTAMTGFDAMRALSTRNDEPAAASRPFDADRDGFVMAEGAGVLLLESRDRARERGVEPYAAVGGVGLSGDAAHPTRPPEDARGLRRSMRAAIDDAGLAPDAVDLVNAHATATPRGDAHEATAVDAVLPDPLVWAPKGGLGHALGAAGAVETGLAARALAAGVVPPTPNHETPDPDCPVRVATAARDADPGSVLCNSAGFGGTNASLVLTEP